MKIKPSTKKFIYDQLVKVQIVCLVGMFFIIASNIEIAWMSAPAILISSFSLGITGIVCWWVCVKLGVPHGS